MILVPINISSILKKVLVEFLVRRRWEEVLLLLVPFLLILNQFLQSFLLVLSVISLESLNHGLLYPIWTFSRQFFVKVFFNFLGLLHILINFHLLDLILILIFFGDQLIVLFVWFGNRHRAVIVKLSCWKWGILENFVQVDFSWRRSIEIFSDPSSKGYLYRRIFKTFMEALVFTLVCSRCSWRHLAWAAQILAHHLIVNG